MNVSVKLNHRFLPGLKNQIAEITIAVSARDQGGARPAAAPVEPAQPVDAAAGFVRRHKACARLDVSLAR